ncbi:hypothetical protein Pfo_031480 [Paulownia fortunei]|nr:hypothetical protein Pfo_031480 [Paulownia fortunei]
MNLGPALISERLAEKSDDAKIVVATLLDLVARHKITMTYQDMKRPNEITYQRLSDGFVTSINQDGAFQSSSNVSGGGGSFSGGSSGGAGGGVVLNLKRIRRISMADKPLYNQDSTDVLVALKTDAKAGLTGQEAKARFEKNGPNQLNEAKSTQFSSEIHQPV